MIIKQNSAYLKLFILAFEIFLIANLCACIGSKNTTSFNLKTEMVRKYKYFDLFTMQGIEPCDNDSCVTVRQNGDSIQISYNIPTEYSLTLLYKGDYWYSMVMFDTDKNPYCLAISEPWPRRYDTFIQNDTIFEFCQMYFKDMVDKAVYIKTPEQYEVFDLKAENYTDTIPEQIFNKILMVKNKKNSEVIRESHWTIKRNTNQVEFMTAKSRLPIIRTYPELLIRGGEYGL